MKPLTPDQINILTQVAAGRTNQQIATNTKRTYTAIATAATRMYRQMGAQTRAHAVAIGYDLGVLEPGASGRVGAP